MTEVSVTREKVTRYRVKPANNDVGLFVVETGTVHRWDGRNRWITLDVTTPWVSGSHHWAACGDERVSEFLGSCDYDYLLGKFGKDCLETDRDATLDRMRRWVLERRRQRILSKVRARKAWDEIPTHDDLPAYTESNYSALAIIAEAFGYEVLDLADLYVHRKAWWVDRFMALYWQPFVAALAEDEKAGLMR